MMKLKVRNPTLTALYMVKQVIEWQERDDEDEGGFFGVKKMTLLITMGFAAAVGAIALMKKLINSWLSKGEDSDDFVGPVQPPEMQPQSWLSKKFSEFTGAFLPTQAPRTATPQGPVSIVERAPRGDKNIDLSKVDVSVQEALKEASRISGIKPHVLYAIANKESRLGKFLQASTSSARGLMQLTKGTFRELVAKYGPSYGIGLSDIDDHRANAILGSLYLRELAQTYQKNMNGQSPSITELYLMYLLGPGGGLKFIRSMRQDPSRIVAQDMPTAASNNPSVFFHKRTGPLSIQQPRSYHEVFSYLSTEVEDVGHNLAQRINEQASVIPRPGASTEMVKPAGIVHVVQSTPAQTIPVPQRVATSRTMPPKLKVEMNRTALSIRRVAQNIIPSSRPVKQPQEMIRLKSGLVVAAN
jgi:hypothetical protein